MRPRILLFLALLGGVLLGAAYFRATRQVASLQSELASSQLKNEQQLLELTAARSSNLELQHQLDELDTSLGATKTRLTATEAARVQLGREIRDLRDQLLTATSHATQLMSDIATLRVSLAKAKEDRASPESVAAYQKTITELEKELAATEAKLAAQPITPEQPTGVLLTTNRSRSAIVVSVGPSNAFVVVNYGANHGALPAQIMSIQRGTDILARALISDVRENYSIAQIQPESLRGALHKGDSAVLAQ